MLITIKLAFPSVMRFAVCVLILFVSFVLCGWLVLGPYNLRVSMADVVTYCILSYCSLEILSLHLKILLPFLMVMASPPLSQLYRSALQLYQYQLQYSTRFISLFLSLFSFMLLSACLLEYLLRPIIRYR